MPSRRAPAVVVLDLVERGDGGRAEVGVLRHVRLDARAQRLRAPASSPGRGRSAGSFVEVGRLVPAGDAGAVPEARHPCRIDGHYRSIPPEDRVEHRQRRDEVGDVGVAHHRRGRLEVHEARVAHVHARGLARAVGAHEAAELAARALDRVVHLARRYPEALGDELEVVDERLHRGGELVARRQRDLAVVGDVRALGQAVERLADDLHRLLHLGQAHRVAVVVVALGADRDA